MNRIQLIFNEKWAMAREDYYNLVSLSLPSIHSGNFKEVEAFFEKDTVTAYASDLNFVGRWNLEDSGLPSDSVAVIVLEGTLYSWETFRLQEYIAQAATNDRIAGIILWINGPGGMITGLDNASKMISECPKPVVAYIAGACASAHFWLASAADKRFLGSLMCEVGSIGVVGTYYNAKEALKKEGIDYREIYPDSADLKNREHREIAENNNEEPYKEKLSKLHMMFCRTVSENLSIAYDKDSPVFRGATFMGDEAVREGLADGYNTLEGAARWILAQSVINKTNQIF